MDSCVDRSTAISTRVRLFRLFLLIPCWESQRLIPKRSAGPRATKIGVVSLKALDHHRPNREESPRRVPVCHASTPPPTSRRASSVRRPGRGPFCRPGIHARGRRVTPSICSHWISDRHNPQVRDHLAGCLAKILRYFQERWRRRSRKCRGGRLLGRHCCRRPESPRFDQAGDSARAACRRPFC